MMRFAVLIFCTLSLWGAEWRNWDGSVFCPDVTLYAPKSLQEIPLKKGPYRVTGTGHSWGEPICPYAGIISTQHFTSPPRLYKEKEEHIVEVGVGVTIGELLAFLEKKGRTLETFPYWPKISIGGAVATASHGTSFKQGTISESVVGVEIYPKLRKVELGAVAASIGKLGVITKLRLKTAAAKIYERKIDAMAFDSFLSHWDALIQSNLYLEARWDVSTGEVLVLRYHEPGHKFETLPEIGLTGSLQELMEKLSLTKKGMPSALFNTSSLLPRLEAEYAIDRSRSVKALKAFQKFAQEKDLSFSKELSIRFGGRDTLAWLSPARSQEGVIFLNVDLFPGEEAILREIEEFFIEEFGARPHWGKFHTNRRDLMEKAYGDALSRFEEYQGKDLRALFGPLLLK